jgi:hypothetical protein
MYLERKTSIGTRSCSPPAKQSKKAFLYALVFSFPILSPHHSHYFVSAQYLFKGLKLLCGSYTSSSPMFSSMFSSSPMFSLKSSGGRNLLTYESDRYATASSNIFVALATSPDRTARSLSLLSSVQTLPLASLSPASLHKRFLEIDFPACL